MARPNEVYSSRNAVSPILTKPSRILMSAGSSYCIFNVSGFSISVSLESTGLIQYALIRPNASSEISPSRRYVTAVRITGSWFSFRNRIQDTAESALWSNCPGRNSTPNTRPFSGIGNSSSYNTSTGGSEKTVLQASAQVSSLTFSTSYRISTRTRFTLSIPR